MDDTKLPVLIVGAGPTGLMMAIELARRGIPVRIIEKNAAPSDKSKALFVQARTLEIFEHIGIIDEILKHAFLPLGEVIHFDHRAISFNFSKLDSPFPFGVTLPQAETEKILRDHLASLGVNIEWNVELLYFQQKESQVILSLRKGEREEVINASYIVGADGAHSTVRHTLGLAFEGSDLEEGFALADVTLEGESAQDKLQIFIAKQGIIIVFPLPGNVHRVIVTNVLAKNAEGVLDLEGIRALLEERECPVQISHPTWLTYFRIHSRRALKYRVGRVFLAGDAAHIHSPAGGLGMNTGIQDAYNLGWKLALVLQQKAPASFLNSYEKERVPVAQKVLEITEKFTKFMTATSPFRQFIRRWLFPRLISKKWFQKAFLDEAAQLKINYRKSPIVKDEGPLWGVRAGDRLPDALFMTKGGQTKHFYEVLKSKHHTLLIFTGEKVSYELATKWGEDLLKSHHIPFLIITEVSKDARKRLGITDSALILIRPDHYIAFREMPSTSTKKLLLFLSKTMSTS